ncbi:PA24C phospholipase, partial [Amia calva]|nr:PA24C phospholipase [Amia calva]
MVALMGTLSELGAQNLLDSIMYLCGVSGSTMCMSSLYKEKDWSPTVKKREHEMVETLTTGKVPLLKMLERILEAVDDVNYSLTDLWAGTFIYNMLRKEDKQHLSSYTDETMVNPYPIFAVVDKWRLDHKEEHDKGLWFEITRHEAGYPGYGAFVDSSVFGSRFKAGQITERKKEMDMLYLQGLCGSAIGDMKKNIQILIGTDFCVLMQSLLPAEWIIHWFVGLEKEQLGSRIMTSQNENRHLVHRYRVIKSSSTKQGWERCDCKHCTKILLLLELHKPFDSGKDCKPILHSLMATQEGIYGELANIVYCVFLFLCKGECNTLLLKSLEKWDLINREEQRIIICFSNWDISKLLWKLMNWIWGTKFNFLHEFSSQELPKDLVQDEKIYLIDAGLSNNCAYPLVLRKERQVQLILSFDFSAGDPFLTVHQAAEYCKKNNIPFPDIPMVSEEEEACPSDCYIYSGENKPTVMHFPLFNKANCGG